MKHFALLFFFLFSINSFSQFFSDIEANIEGVSFGAASYADFNQDGDMDFILTGSNAPNSSLTKLYENDGNTFVEVTGTGFPDVTLGAVEWGDFNNDNYPDLLIQGYIEGTEVAVTKLFKNNGNGTFTDMAAALPQVYQGAASWADFNNDNYLDFALSGFDETAGTYISKLFKNNQNETFSELMAVNLPGTLLGKIKWADYNNDSFQDFVLTGFGLSNFVTEIWYNNGNETFTKSAIILQKCWLGDVEWADYNNDSNIDLFLTGDNSGTKYSILYHNNGDGTFDDSNEIFSGVSHSSVEWADFDNDGDLDIFLAGTGDAMGSGAYLGMVYLNDLGDFTQTISLQQTYWGDCKAFDFNNDSYVDLLINGYDIAENPYAALFKNSGTIFTQDLESIFSLYPNPTKHFVTIANSTSPLIKIIITDYLGKIIYSDSSVSDERILDVSLYSKGVYLIELHSKLGITHKKLIID